MFTINLKRIANQFNLEVLTNKDELEKIHVSTSALNRPGLQISGYTKHFPSDRIQIIGTTELEFIKEELNQEQTQAQVDNYFSLGFPALIITKGLKANDEIIECSKKYSIPVMRTKMETTSFIGILTDFLNGELAPRESVHGVLVEVYGEGVLIVGESGVGKSETAMELVKRGHRLVADDLVEIRKVSDKTLVGTSPASIRHFLEIRGIGIVDVKNLFGMGSVKNTERIDLIINLEPWVKDKEYERLGINTTYKNILGNYIPSLVMPVKPGRNLAIIVEVAAMNRRQQVEMGYNAAEELSQRLMNSAYNEED